MTPNRSRPSKSPSDDSVLSDKGSSKQLVPDSPTPHTQESSTVLRIYIIPAKLSPEALESLLSLVEGRTAQNAGTRILELTTDVDHAHVIVTAVHTRARFERHVPWEVAKTKFIVTPEWLRESADSGIIQPTGNYPAIGYLCDAPEIPSIMVEAGGLPPEAISNYGEFLLSADSENIDLTALNHLSNFSCQRASHLTCPNQAFVEELDIIRKARFYEGEERSMLSYTRAIAVIKAYPSHFDGETSEEDIRNLPYVGAKITSMVAEFVKTGKVAEARSISTSARFLSLSAFNNIHGIGPQTARHLYSLGLRTIEDLVEYYEVTPGMVHEETLPCLDKRPSNEISVEKSIQVALILRHDLSQKIPREEVEEINQVIKRELNSIALGYRTMIVGGYRRGKLESNDVDIIVTHSDWESGAGKVNGLCKKLVEKLREHGLVKHVLHMNGHHPHNVFRTHHWDSLEKAFTVFLLPCDSGGQRSYRRVDLIFATPAVFWTAVVGWTGSTMFERDLRLWAKQKKGLKFDSSGITRRHDSKPFFPKSEKEVFELLGLAYVHPIFRNADA